MFHIIPETSQNTIRWHVDLLSCLLRSAIFLNITFVQSYHVVNFLIYFLILKMCPDFYFTQASNKILFSCFTINFPWLSWCHHLLLFMVPNIHLDVQGIYCKTQWKYVEHSSGLGHGVVIMRHFFIKHWWHVILRWLLVHSDISHAVAVRQAACRMFQDYSDEGDPALILQNSRFCGDDRHGNRQAQYWVIKANPYNCIWLWRWQKAFTFIISLDLHSRSGR